MAQQVDKNIAQKIGKAHGLKIWWSLWSKNPSLYPHFAKNQSETILSSRNQIKNHVVKKCEIWSICRQRILVLIHVVVKKFKFWSMLSSKNSNFDPCCRRKVRISIHVVVSKFEFQSGYQKTQILIHFVVELPEIDPSCHRRFDDFRHNRH